MPTKKAGTPKQGMGTQLAAAMIDHARTKSIQLCLDKHGPVYVRALVPKYAQKDFELQAYSAWYIGHVDVQLLDEERVNAHINEFDGDFSDGLDEFMAFLESKGYIIFHSAYEEGVIVLDVEE